MSLSIDVERVEQVLLADGKWHRMMDKSFIAHAYELKSKYRPSSPAQKAYVRASRHLW